MRPTFSSEEYGEIGRVTRMQISMAMEALDASGQPRTHGEPSFGRNWGKTKGAMKQMIASKNAPTIMGNVKQMWAQRKGDMAKTIGAGIFQQVTGGSFYAGAGAQQLLQGVKVGGMSANIVYQAIRLAAIIATSKMNQQATIMKGAQSQLQASEGLLATPNVQGGRFLPSYYEGHNFLLGSGFPSYSRMYDDAKNVKNGLWNGTKAVLQSWWEGNNLSRAIQDGQQEFYGHQTWKHPDVIKHRVAIGYRIEREHNRYGPIYGGWKETGPIGG